MQTDNSYNVAYVHSAFAMVQQEHLVTRDAIHQEFFTDGINRIISDEELNAAFTTLDDVSDVPMSAEEFRKLLTGEYVEPAAAIIVGQVGPAETEMSLGVPRVIGFNAIEQHPLNEYHEASLTDSGRIVLGGCIPSVKWGELDSIITYLGIFKEISERVPDEKLDKPAYTKAQIEAEIIAETQSATYLVMMKKLRKRLLVDGNLELDVVRKLNEAGFRVSHVVALRRLTVEISSGNNLTWEV